MQASSHSEDRPSPSGRPCKYTSGRASALCTATRGADVSRRRALLWSSQHRTAAPAEGHAV